MLPGKNSTPSLERSTTNLFHSIFGRIVPGALADKVGKFNMQSLWCFVSAIIVLALGIHASSNAAYITFAGLYGFASGAYVSLLPAQIAHISKVEQIGVRVGVTFACISFAGLVGNPIAGAIVVAEKGGYRGLNIFSGVMLMAGAIVFTVARFYLADWKLLRRV
jgi:predicted MFS family arabinose efflux permease